MKKINFDKNLLFVFFISLLPLVNLLTPGLLVTHDAWLHGGRLASFYQSLADGILIPRWAGNLNLGYGHPILMFVYPLPSYLGSIIHFVGFTYTDSIKILLSFSYILSAVFMYLWIKEFLGKNAATVSAILYIFAPYRFVDIYVRGALGEHMAFTFMPLVMFALLKLNNSNKKQLKKYYFPYLFSAISFALLVLTHNAISLIFIPFIILYLIYLYLESKNKLNLLINTSSIIYGALLSFFFWFPAFAEGKYTLRDIVTKGEYAKHFVNPLNLIYGEWSYGGSGFFTTQIGIIPIVFFIISLFFLIKIFRKKDKNKILLFFSQIIFIGSLFIMLKQSQFIWEMLSTLPKIQFPWRFLAIVVFSSSVIGGILISKLKNKYLIFLIILLIILPTVFYWHAKSYDKSFTDDYFKNTFKGTTDTGEVSPIWSIRFMESPPKDTIEVIDGKAKIEKLGRKSDFHEYIIKSEGNSRIRENTLYFPGWYVYDNGNKISEIEFQDPKNRGLITFRLSGGMHNIILKFEDTKLRKASNYISLFSVVLIFISLPLLIKSKLKFKKK